MLFAPRKYATHLVTEYLIPADVMQAKPLILITLQTGQKGN